VYVLLLAIETQLVQPPMLPPLLLLLQVKRGSGLNRDTALAAAAAYQSLYCDDDEGDHIQATYQVRNHSVNMVMLQVTSFYALVRERS
jgi:hypothetical protein